jgi:hypothetical protein
MNCPCDERIFPPPLNIRAGLPALPRQIATFPEFRAALLAAIPTKGALAAWRARSNEDFGVMLLEMWAYVCDCIAFYDKVRADEFYDRTAQLRSSVRGLTNLLGYIPRPAVAAVADLAVIVDGRQPLVLPIGTAFRSSAFPGSAPQVFELTAPARVHPFTNRWTIAPVGPSTIGEPFLTVALTHLMLDPSSVAIKKGSIVLFEVAGRPGLTTARAVKALGDVKGDDGATYKKVEWDGAIAIAGSTPVASIRLSTPTRTARLTTKKSTANEDPINNVSSVTFLHFDAIYNGIGLNSQLIVARDGDVRYFSVPQARTTSIQLTPATSTSIEDGSGTVTAVVNSPGTTVEVTDLQLDTAINDPGRRLPGTPAWQVSDAPALTVHFAFVEAGTVASPARATLGPRDPLLLLPPLDTPQDGKSPGRFALSDKNGLGSIATGQVSFSSRVLTLDTTTALPASLVNPVQAYGNIISAVRGETAPMEVLGTGDATVLNQRFTLAKSPLTYVPASTDAGVASTLTVYVDGVMWTEAPGFFGVGGDDQVYIVRQNDDGASVVTFNGRLATGSVVAATYRFGAGKAVPPAGTITQLARPPAGLKSVRHVTSAYGGDDAEPASQIRTLAPRSALLLGRAISIPDFQTAAAGTPGVRAATAEWNWSATALSAVVHVYYIGDESLRGVVLRRVRSLTDPSTPIHVERAAGVPVTLSISIAVDPRRVEADVRSAVRAALLGAGDGLLTPERVGIGLPLFRSQLFETILDVPGALAVDGLFWNGAEMADWGMTPGAGRYFDLEAGALLLNGTTGVP